MQKKKDKSSKNLVLKLKRHYPKEKISKGKTKQKKSKSKNHASNRSKKKLLKAE
jgi:hypothetical protein